METKMQSTNQPDMIAGDLDDQREILKKSIDDIAGDIGMALRDANLRFPVYITVPSSGDSLVSIATPLDPSDDNWERATAIACEVIGRWLGVEKLRSRPMICAIADTARISVSELAQAETPNDASQ
jgi:hypothetical protein